MVDTQVAVKAKITRSNAKMLQRYARETCVRSPHGAAAHLEEYGEITTRAQPLETPARRPQLRNRDAYHPSSLIGTLAVDRLFDETRPHIGSIGVTNGAGSGAHEWRQTRVATRDELTASLRITV